jgi:anti-anti-sigma factor
MGISVTLIRIAPRESEAIDYNTVIFKLTVNGPLDFDTSEEASTIFKTLLAGGAIKLIIDLKLCSIIDSAGIGILLNSAKAIRERNGDMVLIKASDEVNSIVRLTNLQLIIPFFEKEDQAVSYLSYHTRPSDHI